MALTDVKSEQIQSSVALAGSPTTTTQSASDNSTKIATTAYVETAVANLVASAPAALNTLDELAAALNDDASFSTTITNSIATKLPLAGGTLTGNLRINTTLGIGAAASSVIGVYSTKSFANGLAAELSNTESSTGSGLVVKGGNNASTYSADFRDYNSNSLMRIRGDGNVGIGTTSPGNLLEVDAGTGTNAGITIRMGTGSSGANDSFIGFENSAGTEIFRTRYDNPTTSYVISSDTAGHIITVQRDGDVGIGDSSPSQKLNVAGNIMLEGNNQYLYLTNVGTGNSGIYVRGNTASSYLRSHSTGKFTWEVTGSQKMELDANGQLGIGITPTNKLTVFGTGAGNATVQIEGEGGADPYINFLANNTQHWSVGVDDSDDDKFKISKHSALGTND